MDDNQLESILKRLSSLEETQTGLVDKLAVVEAQLQAQLQVKSTQKSTKYPLLTDEQRQDLRRLLIEVPSQYKTATEIPIPIVVEVGTRDKKTYFVLASHILTFIEVMTGRKIPTKWNLTDNPRCNNTPWYRDKNFQNKFNVEIRDDTTYALLNTFNIKMISTYRKKVVLIKLDTQPTYSPELVCKNPNFRLGLKQPITVSFSDFIECLKEQFFASKALTMVDYSQEVVRFVPKSRIMWENPVPDKERMQWVQLHPKNSQLLQTRINHFNESISKLKDLTVEKKLNDLPVDKKTSFHDWVAVSGLMKEQMDYLWNTCLELADKSDFQSKTAFSLLLGSATTNKNTLTSYKQNLQVILGFFVACYFTYVEIKYEPDILSLFLCENFTFFLQLCLNYGKSERGNKEATAEKRVAVCNVLYLGFLHKQYPDIATRQRISIHPIWQRLWREVRRQRRIASGLTSVDSGKAMTHDHLKAVADTLHHKLVFDVDVSLEQIQQALFYAFAVRMYAFRAYHYLGMQWGTNLNTLDKYTKYTTTNRDEQKDPLLFAKKFCDTYLKKNPEERFCVGFNQLSGHIAHKRSAHTAVFLEFYYNMSTVLQDASCRWLLVECFDKLKSRQIADLHDYLKYRRDNFEDSKKALLFFSSITRTTSPVDLLSTLSPGKEVFAPATKKGEAYLLRLYRKAIPSDKYPTYKEMNIRHLRRATIEYASKMGISDKTREVLCRTVYLHNITTNTEVYDQTNRFFSSPALKTLLDGGKATPALISQANQEAVGFEVVEDLFDLVNISRTLNELINEVSPLWDYEPTQDCLVLYDLTTEVDISDIEELADLDDYDHLCTLKETYPEVSDPDTLAKTWLLKDLVIVALCQLTSEGNGDRVNYYLSNLSDWITVKELKDYERSQLWTIRQEVLSEMPSSKKRRILK